MNMKKFLLVIIAITAFISAQAHNKFEKQNK